MKLLLTVVIHFILLGYLQCQSLNEIDVDKMKDVIEKGIGDIPDLPNFNTTNIPSAEDVEKVLREKCEKNGAPDAVDLLKEEQEKTTECLESFVNITVVQEELEEAKKTGSMGDVFTKYCKKWPEIKTCFDNATSIARQCMEQREQSALNNTLDILNELQDFMCTKEGDRLAMFVAEDGFECVKDQNDGIQECINKTIGARIPDPEDFSITNLPVFLFADQDCEDFDTVRVCIVKKLEKCKNSTPANIVDALFKFLKKKLPCNGAIGVKNSNDKDASNCSAISVVLLIICFLYVRFF